MHKFLKFIFGIKLYMFRTVPLSFIRGFSLYTQQWFMSYTIAVCTVLGSWWWTEELSETCRVVFQKYIWEIGASSWFYYMNLSRCTLTCTSNSMYFITLIPYIHFRDLYLHTTRHFTGHFRHVHRPTFPTIILNEINLLLLVCVSILRHWHVYIYIYIYIHIYVGVCMCM